MSAKKTVRLDYSKLLFDYSREFELKGKIASLEKMGITQQSLLSYQESMPKVVSKLVLSCKEMGKTLDDYLIIEEE